jgi:hypothetical protein
MALDNLSTKLEFLVDCNVVEACFLNVEWVHKHEYFNTDVSSFETPNKNSDFMNLNRPISESLKL